MARPYNHPDNLDLNGQPKMSENAWALHERLHGDAFEALNALMEDLTQTKRKVETILPLIDSLSQIKNQIETLLPIMAEVEKIKIRLEPTDSAYISISNLRSAIIAMAAKVDNTSNPGDNFVASLQQLL